MFLTNCEKIIHRVCLNENKLTTEKFRKSNGNFFFFGYVKNIKKNISNISIKILD